MDVKIYNTLEEKAFLKKEAEKFLKGRKYITFKHFYPTDPPGDYKKHHGNRLNLRDVQVTMVHSLHEDMSYNMVYFKCKNPRGGLHHTIYFPYEIEEAQYLVHDKKPKDKTWQEFIEG